MEAFGKVTAILFSVFILFIAPLMYMAQKQDAITQDYVLTETVNLVDSIKNSGYITNEMYRTYLRKIGSTDNAYEITISQSHHIIMPKADSDTLEAVEGVADHYNNTYTEDIIGNLEKDGIHRFSQGDYISMKVYNKNKTFGTRIMEALLLHEVPAMQIYVTYGGAIRDEDY